MKPAALLLTILSARDSLARDAGYPCGRPALGLDTICAAAADVGVPLAPRGAFRVLRPLVAAGKVVVIRGNTHAAPSYLIAEGGAS